MAEDEKKGAKEKKNAKEGNGILACFTFSIESSPSTLLSIMRWKYYICYAKNVPDNWKVEPMVCQYKFWFSPLWKCKI